MNILRSLSAILIAALFSVAGIISAITKAVDSGFKDVSLFIPVLVVLGFLLLLGLLVVYAYFWWRRFTWEIAETEIHIRSGIFFKKQIHVPFQRVQSIDFNAGILERIVGIVQLKVETAGGSANKAVSIPALKLNEAEALRAEVFARKRAIAGGVAGGIAPAGGVMAGIGAAPLPPGAVPPPPQPGALLSTVRGVESSLAGARGLLVDDYQEDAPIEYEYGLTVKEIVLSAISNEYNYVTVLLILAFFSQIPGYMAAFGDFDDVTDRALLAVTSMALPVALMVAAITLLVLMLLAILGSALSFGGFKARRRGGRIEVERGLLQRQYRGVAIKRVQSVEINQGFIRRMLGYASLKLHTVDSMEGSSSQQGQNKNMPSIGLVLHPFIKMDRVEMLLAGMLPEFNNRPSIVALHPLPGRALRRAANRKVVAPLVVAGVIFGIWDWIVVFALAEYFSSSLAKLLIATPWVLLLVYLALAIADAVLWYRHAGYGWNDSMLTLRQGGFSIATTFIPRQKIQFASIRMNPLQRLSNVATIQARTAAGVGGTTTRLRDLQRDQAEAYLDWVRPSVRKSV
ncbi:MAG: PH domain-containing protein [Coriobacteriales bacterium]|nr:PH domain-containing protein [Coriobacteriales bacterium]